MSALIYVVMIFAWGLSWIAIKWQQGDVAMEVSIFYRFALAAIIMFIIGYLGKKLQKSRAIDHVFFCLQGLVLFCANFLAFYNATYYIPSGLVAVFMATSPIFNACHARLFYKTPITTNFWIGATLGLSGISLLFSADFMALDMSSGASASDTLYGLMYSLIGTWCFSIGNMISMRNHNHDIQPFTSTAYGMVYGCIALLIIIVVQGLPFNIELSSRYLGSLLYLAVPASVIGFTAYLILVNRIGASNAAYVLVITPIVALISSAIFESYVWTSLSTLGLVCVLLGNIIAQQKQNIFTRARSWLKIRREIETQGS